MNSNGEEEGVLVRGYIIDMVQGWRQVAQDSHRQIRVVGSGDGCYR